MNRALLEKPFEPAQIRQRKGRNGVLDYVEGHNVIHRLNEALDGAWSFEITHHEVRELEHQLSPVESEIAAFEHEMDGRLALERERAAADGI